MNDLNPIKERRRQRTAKPIFSPERAARQGDQGLMSIVVASAYLALRMLTSRLGKVNSFYGFEAFGNMLLKCFEHFIHEELDRFHEVVYKQ
jgi:hypothetical protein